MIGAPFISLFLLDYIGLKLYQVLFLWTTAAVGGRFPPAGSVGWRSGTATGRC